MTRLALALALLLAGCPGEAPRADAPPDVRYGVDPCDRCAMIVSEERFAAAYVTPSGEARRFDDLGCLTAFLVERPEPVAEVWVHDDDSRAWARGREAWFARSPTLITPMGTGLIAVRDEARARARGEPLSFDQLKGLGPRAWPQQR